ncbi:MAG: substrate-binding domain-containing protein [Magnetococcales bacterium]|nr:substrate-binding domain-containing protein [Magnetococcales bacterium]
MRDFLKHLNKYLFLFFLLLAATAQAEPLRVSGTGAAISTIKRIGEIYRQSHPELSFQFLLPPMGSSGAIKALTTDQLDLALTGRPLKKEEQEAGLIQEWVGHSPFVFVVHQDSPATHITQAQLADFYAGRQNSWPDGSRVRTILRPLADADTTLLKSISPAMREAVEQAHARRQPGSALAETDLDLANMVEKVPGGLGGVALTLILAEQRPLKGLILDGVEPTVDALDKKQYPYSKPLYLVLRQESPASLRGFVTFLRSTEGQALLRQNALSVVQP